MVGFVILMMKALRLLYTKFHLVFTVVCGNRGPCDVQVYISIFPA